MYLLESNFKHSAYLTEKTFRKYACDDSRLTENTLHKQRISAGAWVANQKVIADITWLLRYQGLLLGKPASLLALA
jgi:hypothetical protein